MQEKAAYDLYANISIGSSRDQQQGGDSRAHLSEPVSTEVDDELEEDHQRAELEGKHNARNQALQPSLGE